MPQYYHLNDNYQRANFNQEVDNMRAAGRRVRVEIVEEGVTPKQFSAMHLWFRHCAEALQAAGVDMRAIMAKREVEVPVTEHAFKETCYKPLLAAMEGKDSTKDQTTKDCPKVRETLHRHFAEKHGVQLPPWPDRFTRGLDD